MKLEKAKKLRRPMFSDEKGETFSIEEVCKLLMEGKNLKAHSFGPVESPGVLTTSNIQAIIYTSDGVYIKTQSSVYKVE